MRVQVRLEGRGDLRWAEGEEGGAGDGACVVDEDCAGAELGGVAVLVFSLVVKRAAGWEVVVFLFLFFFYVRLALLLAWLFVRPRCGRRRTCRSARSPALRSALLAHGCPRRQR